MVPTSLSVRNFMCYRTPVDIDLRGVRVACLSGDNGAGKSALLDCITWALWGKARVNNDRQLMALNATEMEVTFGFVLNRQEFRVIRRRTRGGSGPLTLDLQIRDGERWRSISGATARETQRAIDGLLRMDYDTFINSAFILQGRADEFTTKTPASRKQVLADILNLSDYDRLEELARGELRERDRRLQETDGEIARTDQSLRALPGFKADVERLSALLVSLSGASEAIAERLSTVRQLLSVLELTAQQRAVLRNEIGALEREITELEAEHGRITTQIAAQQAVLTRKDEIEAELSHLNELRQQDEELNARLRARQGLLDERREHERAIQQAVHAVESELRSVRDQSGKLARLVGSRPALVTQLDQVRRQTAVLPVVKRSIDETRQEQLQLQTRRGELQAQNKQLKGEMEALKARMEQIRAEDAICPICRRPLGDEEREQIRGEYQTEGTALGDRYRANGAEMKRIEAELKERSTELDGLERQRAQLDSLCRTEANLQLTLQQSEDAARDLEALQAREAEIAALMSSDQIAAGAKCRLAAVEQRLLGVPYEADAHEAVQREITALGRVQRDVDALRLAGGLLQELDSRRELIVGMILQRRADREQKVAREAELAAQLTRIDEHRALQADLEAEHDRLTRERAEAQEAFGRARAGLEACEQLEQQREELLQQRTRLVEEKVLYDELMLAFGKRGIQAMVIENIVPELQDEANAILDRMPGNTMRVEFLTQRQALSGDGIIETLDIIIGDEAGRRPYELYSGGEAFRVNFAIRVALSTLLARRAGARLQTLVIDEGFGTQDSRGRDGLIEAIRAIERDFEMILVITHIAELKEQFPTRIDVVKSAGGSLVSVN